MHWQCFLFPVVPAACALAWLWRPVTDSLRPQQESFSPRYPNPHPPEPSHIVFIIGSAGSGKRKLLEEAYKLLPAGREDSPLEGWMPPVDIIIVPDTDGVSLRSIWTPGAFGHPCINTPCNNTDLTGKINLSCNIPASLFQDWVCLLGDQAREEHIPPPVPPSRPALTLTRAPGRTAGCDLRRTLDSQAQLGGSHSL
ncbi:hypothetical protein FA13DRAFT_490709 [Coprinellus micaceus]|uniref:Uncharacterized protein n=1 Tax=Coprinellus micaceus TaxID=71717 RepID=A0A4Y7SCS8_COPMI|nr:hypothetical protein FA13DRAFT_490709 [Coprinellus micaceus]